MAVLSTAVSHGALCGRNKRQGEGTCTQPAGWGTYHPGVGACKFHGGNLPTKHGRYSGIKREALRELIEHHEADPDPLNIFPELAAARALFQDFIERYDDWREAVVAWHVTYRASGRPVPGDLRVAFEAALDEYEALLNERGESSDKQEEDLAKARKFVELLSSPHEGKPLQVLDIGDAYRILSEVTKIAERIERIRASNAISRPDLMRVMQEMGRIVTHHVTDPEVQQAIKEGWLGIRV
jgi:hypothetical protein